MGQTIAKLSWGVLLGLLQWALAGPALAIDLKADTVTLNAPTPAPAPAFTNVTFRESFDFVPVVVAVPTAANPEPDSVRIRNVTTTGFEVAVVHPDGSSGAQNGMTVDYIAMEPGTHVLGGNTVVAGSFTTTSEQGRNAGASSWDAISFGAAFAQSPAVLTAVQTTNNEPSMDLTTPSRPWLEVAVRNVTASGMEMALERGETSSGTVSTGEEIGYIALAAGADATFTDTSGATIRYQAVRSSDTVTDNCTSVGFNSAFAASPAVAVGSQNKRDGPDGGWAKRCSLSASSAGLLVEEDWSQDVDGSHTTEIMGLGAFSQAFHASSPQVSFHLEADSVSVGAYPEDSLSWTSVNFPTAFNTTPLVFSLPTEQGPEPAKLRLRNVSTTGFDIAQVEPNPEPGAHERMTVDYLAIAPGVTELTEGFFVEAGEVSTTATQLGPDGFSGGGTWNSVGFAHGAFSNPVVLTAIQTINNEPGLDPSVPSSPWLAVAVDNISSSGFDVALDRTEVNDGSAVSSPESIGWLAVEADQTATLIANGGGNVRIESRGGSGIQGHDDGCFSTSWLSSFGTTPLAVASQNTRNGSNGGWLRRCAVDSNGIGLLVDEDRFIDNERGHINEDVGILSLESSLEYDFPSPQVDADLAVNGLPADTVDPGSVNSQKITMSNPGVLDAHNLVVRESIGELSGLAMATFSGQPFQFNDDTPATGLSISQREYSDDGGATWSYTPAASGIDYNVTDFRITFSGTLPPGASVSLDFETGIR
jgi:hypothetical protein